MKGVLNRMKHVKEVVHERSERGMSEMSGVVIESDKHEHPNAGSSLEIKIRTKDRNCDFVWNDDSYISVEIRVDEHVRLFYDHLDSSDPASSTQREIRAYELLSDDRTRVLTRTSKRGYVFIKE
ncbi:hypothetical protein CMI38_02065 [Candidatus Pacearchaeota archaeon]|nr:hypothetical protein [Candidatus Pacearchaeota archaeon]|tara:strand:- start:57 stop:428 length:372 start_codon:yes stop_codon:yes gene_type:complete